MKYDILINLNRNINILLIIDYFIKLSTYKLSIIVQCVVYIYVVVYVCEGLVFLSITSFFCMSHYQQDFSVSVQG